MVTTVNYITSLKFGQRKDEREKINKKEKEKRNLTLKMVVKARKNNLVRKNFFQDFFGAAVCGSFSFLAEAFDGGRQQCYSGVSNLEMER